MQLRTFQRCGVDELKTHSHFILADDMGLGKTIQTLWAIMELELNRVLIVCPASVKENWGRQIYKIFDFTTINILGNKKGIAKHANFNICSYDYLIRNSFDFHGCVWDLVVFDEAHYLKNMHAKRTWACLGDSGVVRKARKAWFLTGTPLTNTPLDLYPIAVTCFSKHFSDCLQLQDYMDRFCIYRYDKWGNLRVLGTRNEKDFAQRIDRILLRRTKSEVAKELPKVSIEMTYLDPTNEVKALIDMQLEKLQTATDSRNVLGITSKAMSELSLQKAKAALQYILDKSEHSKLVVYYIHRNVLELFLQSTEANKILYIDGSVDSKKRQGIIELFQKDKHRNLLFAQISATGTGTDGLQRATSYGIFLELPWLSTEFDQAIGRLDRIGQTLPVNIEVLLFENSLDERVLKSMSRKGDNIQGVISTYCSYINV